MQTPRVRLFSLFGAMLFLLNLLVSNVIYHNICILSTLILKNLMYFKSICELTPISAPRIHHFPSPFITFPTFPILLSAHSLLTSSLSSPHSALSLCPPHIPLLHSCFALASSSHFALHIRLSSPPFHCFGVIFSPMTAEKPFPTAQKAALFSFFKEILQKPLTNRKKVLY